METKYFISKKVSVSVVREVFEDDSIYLHLYNIDGSQFNNSAALIGSYGGVEGFWAACVSKDVFNQRLEARFRANSPERVKEREMRNAARRLAIEEARSIAFRDLLARGTPIPTTYETIGIVLRYLNTMNWGGWDLPPMTIGYRCNQYDCDGKQASTMILDEPIDVFGELIDKFVVGAPTGHLIKYHRC